MSPTLTNDLPTEDEAPETPELPDYGINNRHLPEQLKKAIIAAFTTAQTQEKFVRRDEVLEDARDRFYDVGVQHLYLNSGFNWTMATPGGSYSSGHGTYDYFSDYIDDYPIFPAYAQIVRAKLSEHDPGVDFQPDDPNESADLEAATAAEAMRHDFDRNNDVKLLQQQIIYHWEMGGRAVLWTRTEDSPPRYGDTSGNPPRKVVASVYGSIEAKVPVFSPKTGTCGYVILYDDPDILEAKHQYHWIAEDLSAGAVCLEENTYERIARLAIIQNSTGRIYNWNVGDSTDHLISRGHGFFRLNRYEEMDDPIEKPDCLSDFKDDGTIRTVKEKLKWLYPDGIHAVCVGPEYAESWNQSMDDCIAISHAYIGKGQTRMPIMRPMVVVQDRFNQMMNLIAESTDTRVPSTWLSVEPAEYAAINKQRAKPGAFRNLKKLPPGADIKNYIYREDDYAIPDSLSKFLEFMQALPQFQLAVPPAVWGAAMTDLKTASGYQQAAAQAMGILGSLWDMEVQMFATMYYQNCIAISNDDQYPDQITIPDIKGRRSVVDKASLTKGKFRCFPDKESGFPESTASIRQAWERTAMLLAPTPMGMQVFGAPDNIAEYVRVSGVKLVIPEAESRNKQLREIEILLVNPPFLSQPIAQLLAQGADIPTIAKEIAQQRQAQAAQYQQIVQQQQIEHAGQTLTAQAQGGQAPPAPAVPPAPDPSLIAHSSVPIWPSDYQAWEAAKCQDFLTSDQCNTELTIGRPDPVTGEMKPNVAGVLNVFLHWAEHEAAKALQPPPVTGPLPAVGSPPKMQPASAGS